MPCWQHKENLPKELHRLLWYDLKGLHNNDDENKNKNICYIVIIIQGYKKNILSR